MPGRSVIAHEQTAFLPTVDDLVQVARHAGRPFASTRTIHHWRQLGLITPPHRIGREYRYPLSGIGEVDSFVRWSARQMPTDLKVFARYIEAGTAGSRDPRDACLSVLEMMRPGAEGGRKLAARGEPAVRAEAKAASRARGAHAMLPRRVRLSAAEREAAFYFEFATALDMDGDPEEIEHGRRQLERLMGQRSGRGGATRDISDLAVPVEDLRVDIDTLIRAVGAAAPLALELARSLVELNCVWFPALIPALETPSAQEQPLIDVMVEASKNLVPEVYVILFATRLAGKMSTLSDTEIQTLLHDARPPAIATEMLSDRPARDRELARSRLRPYQRVQLLVQNRQLAARCAPTS
jgi:hypothetical protein